MRPQYLASPIGSVKSLATALGLPEVALRDFAARSAEHYSHFTIPKKNGKPRSVCAPTFHLKVIQKRINRSIFGNVQYPDYLFGGVPGRDYVQNARHHMGAKVAIALDVRDFYPSIGRDRVLDMFKHFCKFPSDVAGILSDLVTLNGAVPQGACTSSHVANLILHDVEHRIVREFASQKLTYSRLLDDICVSSQTELSEARTEAAIDKVRSMLRYKGFKLRQSKTKVTSANNPERLMEVTGLWLNRGQPRVLREERRDIRAAVHRCEALAKISRTSPDYHQEHDRVSGRVSKLAHLGHFEADSYRARLARILPMYDQLDINKTIRLVKALRGSKPGDRASHSYFDRFHLVQYRLGILARNSPGLSVSLRAMTYSVHPTKTRFELIYGAIP